MRRVEFANRFVDFMHHFPMPARRHARRGRMFDSSINLPKLCIDVPFLWCVPAGIIQAAEHKSTGGSGMGQVVSESHELPLSEGPLKGVVVIDITRVVAGPYCTMMLADLGATVIKVENPAEPDYVRTFPPFVKGLRGDASAFFAQYNRHKLGISLDLKTDEGRALLVDLVRKADLIVENFRPGTTERMGLGHEALLQINPRLVYVSISGFGQTGPNSRRPAYDNSAQATGACGLSTARRAGPHYEWARSSVICPPPSMLPLAPWRR